MFIILFLAQKTVPDTEWALKIDCPIKERVSEFMSGIGLSQVSRVNKIKVRKVEMERGPAKWGREGRGSSLEGQLRQY